MPSCRWVSGTEDSPASVAQLGSLETREETGRKDLHRSRESVTWGHQGAALVPGTDTLGKDQGILSFQGQSKGCREHRTAGQGTRASWSLVTWRLPSGSGQKKKRTVCD